MAPLGQKSMEIGHSGVQRGRARLTLLFGENEVFAVIKIFHHRRKQEATAEYGRAHTPASPQPLTEAAGGHGEGQDSVARSD